MKSSLKYSVKQEHEMYLNYHSVNISLNETLVKQEHEMYLNNSTTFILLIHSSVKQEHEMYLNYLQLHITANFLALNRNMRCI